MRPATEMRWRPDPAFTRISLERRTIVLHRDVAGKAAEIIAHLNMMSRGAAGAGNRGSGFKIALDNRLEIFARRSRRGGMIRFLLSDLYIGAHPRQFRELDVSIEARRREIPVAEPLGAFVEWAGPLLYRGYFLSRAVSGMTLWEFVRTDDDPTVRAHVLGEAHAAIWKMHDRGLFHADLNLHNLFVAKEGESFAVMILDLDKSRIFAPPLGASMRQANLERLRRSVRKLDPAGQYFDVSALALLGI